MRLKVVIGVSIAIVCTVATVWFFIQTQSVVSKFLTEYTNAQPSEQETVATHYLERMDLSTMLGALESKYKNSECHVQAHPVGRAVYKKTLNFSAALAQCGKGCNDGCVHGVFMGMFSTDSDTLGGVINEEDSDEYIAHVRAEAKTICQRPEVEAVVQSTFCVHGLGHVFAYVSDYNLPKAIESCDVFEREDIRRVCAGGVFMEYSTYEPKYDELRRKELHLCDTYPNYPMHCYRYIAKHSIFAWGSARSAIHACEVLEQREQRACIAGIAFAMTMPPMLATDTGLDFLCTVLPMQQQRAWCEYGALLKVANNIGDGSYVACDEMAEKYRTRCRNMVDENRALSVE